MEKHVFLTKDMNSFQDGSFESFSTTSEAIKRASELNFRGFIFIGNLKTVNSCTVFYVDDIDGNFKSRNFCYDDSELTHLNELTNFTKMCNFINTHEITNVRKSITYSIDDKKIFGVNFEDVLDLHKIAHL